MLVIVNLTFFLRFVSFVYVNLNRTFVLSNTCSIRIVIAQS